MTTPSIESTWVRDRYADALARSDRTLRERESHLTYLENNAYLMHYARLRAITGRKWRDRRGL